MDCKATVGLGEFSRGGRTRGDHQGCDHDMGCEEKYTPCGIVDEDTGQLYLNFGSSYKTSDFIVDTLGAWWETLDPREQAATAQIQLKIDNGPESSGVRTQFLNRAVQFADQIGKPIQLLYFPPLPQKVQSHRALLGHLGATLEWHEAGRCRNHARLGREHDLERSLPRGRTQSSDLSKGGEAHEEGHAGGGSPVGTSSRFTQVGYLDSTG